MRASQELQHQQDAFGAHLAQLSGLTNELRAQTGDGGVDEERSQLSDQFDECSRLTHVRASHFPLAISIRIRLQLFTRLLCPVSRSALDMRDFTPASL